MAEAKHMLRTKSKSFYWAGQLLPHRQFQDAASLYAFCREMDDAIDERDDVTFIEQSRQQLHSGKGDMAALFQRYGIPKEIVEAFISTLLADRAPLQHESLTSVLRFAYGVAGTVGVMMSHVLGQRDRVILYHAIDLGIAMQLINIARDRTEDAANQRHYIPPGEDAISFVRVAERYFASGMAGIHALPIAVRPAIMSAALIYRAIGQHILRNPDKAQRTRIIVPRYEKAWLTVKALWLVAIGFRKALHSHDASLHDALCGLPCVHQA